MLRLSFFTCLIVSSFSAIAAELADLESADRVVRVKAARDLAESPKLDEAATKALLAFVKLEYTNAMVVPAKSAKKITAIPLDGTETSLVRVKANPKDYVGKPAILCGAISMGSYWNYGYDDAKETHYSIGLTELSKDVSQTGSNAHLYLLRSKGRGLAERLVKAEEQGANGVACRVLVTIDKGRFEDEQWDLFELLDVQFTDQKGGGWEPWLFEGIRTVSPNLKKAGREGLAPLLEAVSTDSEDAASHFVRDIAADALMEMNRETRGVAYAKLRRIADGAKDQKHKLRLQGFAKALNNKRDSPAGK